MRFLTEKIEFPPVETANVDGMVAIGGDLSIPRLLLAYQLGIFPWYSQRSPIIWWSPDPRFVLFPNQLKISKSMKRFIMNSKLKVTFNKKFESVIENCSTIYRPYQGGTWITEEMKESYLKLHKLGYAKSVEVYEGLELVGGLYGVDLGNGVFCGESMFSKISNASKLALIKFVAITDYALIDCQVYTPHLASLGAEEIPRNLFLEYLK